MTILLSQLVIGPVLRVMAVMHLILLLGGGCLLLSPGGAHPVASAGGAMLSFLLPESDVTSLAQTHYGGH